MKVFVQDLLYKIKNMFKDISTEALDAIMQKAWDAFPVYRNVPLQQRAAFMKAIPLSWKPLAMN